MATKQKKQRNREKTAVEKGNWGGVRCKGDVVDIYDGDTITVQVNLKHLCKKYATSESKIIDDLPYIPYLIKCRLAGYNCAEIKQSKHDKDGNPIPEEIREANRAKAKNAKQYLHDNVSGKTIWCHFLDLGEGTLFPKEQDDPYGREITDIYFLDNEGKVGQYFNALMIENGHAKAYNGKGEKKF